ncbi:hypothetical protein [Thiomonas arsenitoxydans]|uniref:TubC N-terminal docking domain-related protein n=1 Tax=Thiomonas arsenitoxydans (strain DSM 22701 / CIP 110005 / 3As) TaxID=426114 RepID=UPI001AD23027|nr:hypothetical protein [Thiomonas arsenitoxydans]MBN8777762.1 hypothetical protein [Thiomonas arsenitoxydans]
MNDDIESVHYRLRRAGLVLSVERGALHARPRSRVTPELQALIAQNRQALITYLQSRATRAADARLLAELKAEAAAIALIERIRAEVRSLPF